MRDGKKKYNLIDWLDQYVFRKSNLWWLILVLFSLKMLQVHLVSKHLRENGISTYGIVVGETPGGRGGTNMVYRYYVPERNQYYMGTTGYSCHKGDTIEVLYDLKRPKRSESKEYLMTNHWRIKNKE